MSRTLLAGLAGVGLAAGAIGAGALLGDEPAEPRTTRKPPPVDLSAAAPKSGEAITYVADVLGPDGWQQKSLTCKADGASVDCGDYPEGVVLHAETGSAPVAASSATAGAKDSAKPCACGPLAPDSKNPCRVTEQTPDGKTNTRDARPGEHLDPGTFSGGCPPKVCWESTLSRRVPGETVPVECGGPGPTMPGPTTPPTGEQPE